MNENNEATTTTDVYACPHGEGFLWDCEECVEENPFDVGFHMQEYYVHRELNYRKEIDRLRAALQQAFMVSSEALKTESYV